MAHSAENEFTAGGLAFTFDSRWEKMPARSPMRLHEFRIPAKDPDAQDGELSVFHFGLGQGGTEEANIERWSAQFDRGGAPVSPEVERRSVAGMGVVLVFLEGDYTHTMMGMPGSAGFQASGGAPEKKKNYAFFGAIVQAPAGRVFFKLVGPANTVRGEREAFQRLAESARPSLPAEGSS